jgi:hypothetical protein
MLSNEGMVSTCPTFDVPSFFGRDIQTFNHFAHSWYGKSIKSQDRSQRPWRIVYPADYLPVGNTDQMRVFDGFVDDLAKFLDVIPERISIADHWKETAPVDERTLLKYMENVCGFSHHIVAANPQNRCKNMGSFMMSTIVSINSAMTTDESSTKTRS